MEKEDGKGEEKQENDTELREYLLRRTAPYAKKAFFYTRHWQKQSKSEERLRLFFDSNDNLELGKASLDIDISMTQSCGGGDDNTSGGILVQGLLFKVMLQSQMSKTSPLLDILKRRVMDLCDLEHVEDAAVKDVGPVWAEFPPTKYPKNQNLEGSKLPNAFFKGLGDVKAVAEAKRILAMKAKDSSKTLTRLDNEMLQFFEGGEEGVVACTTKRWLRCRTSNAIATRGQSISHNAKKRKIEVDVHDFLVLKKILEKTEAFLETDGYRLLELGTLWGKAKVNDQRCLVAANVGNGPLKSVSADMESHCRVIVGALKEANDFSIKRKKTSMDTPIEKQELWVKFSALKAAVKSAVRVAAEVKDLIENSSLREQLDQKWDTLCDDIFHERVPLSFASKPGRGSITDFLTSDSRCSLTACELTFSNSSLSCLDIPVRWQHVCGILENEKLQLPRKLMIEADDSLLGADGADLETQHVVDLMKEGMTRLTQYIQDPPLDNPYNETERGNLLECFGLMQNMLRKYPKRQFALEAGPVGRSGGNKQRRGRVSRMSQQPLESEHQDQQPSSNDIFNNEHVFAVSLSGLEGKEEGESFLDLEDGETLGGTKRISSSKNGPPAVSKRRKNELS